MPLLGIDLGGTKLALAIFDESGAILFKKTIALNKRSGRDVGELIVANITETSTLNNYGPIDSIGICVPGIYRIKTGTVWAPNIKDWEDYPLLEQISKACVNMPVTIDSDRACYILGEAWQGNAKGCDDAIFLSVGTGIGAGILVNGNVLRGAHDIAGAIGWMALQRPFSSEYTNCGCFEQFASGEGIAKTIKKLINETINYAGELKRLKEVSAHDVFEAYKNNDPLAIKTIQLAIEFYGMATANLVSLFNPEKIIFGGGVFGPAISLIPEVKKEAAKWAQPISLKQVSFEASSLGSDAGVYGAAFLALKDRVQNSTR
ncbi:MAG: ROK family protein [Ginsengibacter sp.]|jgi:glucokinase